ncbi:ankyrin repeat domain-containing protein, partial [Candidatus Bathyarchaeota archaeon]|nr:ankyrin repeat domain-containing protein [Candidatus Bathyarchaeota archaeon]
MRPTKRTPLQLAAAKGNFPAVRFLFECGADDAVIAPDGQLALRLAADGGHRDIVAYLPPRRGGGLRRWKAQHATAMRRARKAGRKIAKFLRIFLFDIPFNLFVYAPYKAGAYLWKHKEGIAYTCTKLLVRTPVYAFRAAKKLPKAVARVVAWLWRVSKAAPGRLWRVSKILGAWLARSVLQLGGAVAYIFSRLFSVLHTVFAAMFRFVRDLTVKDVWNGFCALARAVFVSLPVAVARAIAGLGEASYQVLKALLGFFGKVSWWILCA